MKLFTANRGEVVRQFLCNLGQLVLVVLFASIATKDGPGKSVNLLWGVVTLVLAVWLVISLWLEFCRAATTIQVRYEELVVKEPLRPARIIPWRDMQRAVVYTSRVWGVSIPTTLMLLDNKAVTHDFDLPPLSWSGTNDLVGAMTQRTYQQADVRIVHA